MPDEIKKTPLLDHLLNGGSYVPATDAIADRLAARMSPAAATVARLSIWKLDEDGFLVSTGEKTVLPFEERAQKELKPDGTIVETTVYVPLAPIAWGTVNLLRQQQGLPEFRRRPFTCEAWRNDDGTIVEKPRGHYDDNDPHRCYLSYRHEVESDPVRRSVEHCWNPEYKQPTKCEATRRLPFKGDIDDEKEAPQYETCTYPHHKTGHHSWHRESFVDVVLPKEGEAVWAELCGVPKFIERPAELAAANKTYEDIVGWTAYCQEIRGHGGQHGANICLLGLSLSGKPMSTHDTERLTW